MTRARLRILNSTLVGLPARSFSSRILDGVIAIVSGGTSIAAGFLIPSATSVQSLGPIFWTNGGLLVLQGTLSLAWAPAREGLAERYLAMPARTARERRERLRFGEHALDDMAADGTRRRIFSGLGTAATAVVGLGLTYRNQIFNGVAWNLGLPDALIFTTLGVQTIVSLFQLFSASEDERLRDSYWQQVRLLESEEQDSTASTPRVTRSVTTAPSPTAP